jgi:AcrR family transcriptional regulator
MTPTQGGNGRRRTTNGKGSARRSQLLAIAAELFATRGYSQTTVRDIADAAGILSGSLYHHFDSKEAMLSEILHEFLDGLNATFEDNVEKGASPREALDGLVRSSFATIHAFPHAVALYQNEAALLANLPGFDFVAKSGRANEQVWLRVLEAGKKSGDFRKDMEMNLVYRFIRDTVWMSVRWYNPRGKLQHETVAEQYLSMLHGGVLA